MDTCLLLDVLRTRPDSTVRELAMVMREAGLDADRSAVNRTLYRLLRAGAVERQVPAEGGAPRWRLSSQPTTGVASPPPRMHERGLRRVLNRKFRDGLEIALIERRQGQNDPLVDIEVLDGKVVATINLSHPLSQSIEGNRTARVLLHAFIGADALAWARLRRSTEGLGSGRHVALRDAYLREIVAQSNETAGGY